MKRRPKYRIRVEKSNLTGLTWYIPQIRGWFTYKDCLDYKRSSIFYEVPIKFDTLDEAKRHLYFHYTEDLDLGVAWEGDIFRTSLTEGDTKGGVKKNPPMEVKEDYKSPPPSTVKSIDKRV